MNSRIAAALVVVLLLVIGGVAFTTVQNEPDDPDTIDPTFEWRYYNGDGTEITNDISAATIFGEVGFWAHITNDPYPAVSSVQMKVYHENADGTKGDYVGRWYFIEGAYSWSGDLWTLEWDTTTVTDGEYVLEFSYVLEATGGGGDGDEMMFSILHLSMDSGQGDIDMPTGWPEDTIYMVLLAAVVVGAIILLAKYGL